MKPLLKISTVPIKIEMQTTRASFKNPSPIGSSKPSYEMTRQRGGMQIRTTPARVNIDQSAARANTGLKNATQLSRDYAQAGMQAAREASANWNETGNAIVESAGRGNPVAEAAVSEAMRPLSSGADYGRAQPEFSVQEGSISFDYQMDSLTFDWNVNTKPELEFVPASIEYNIAQYPKVIIEYIGEPIYVPASANPNYRGLA
jgi:hypothetical protein